MIYKIHPIIIKLHHAIFKLPPTTTKLVNRIVEVILLSFLLHAEKDVIQFRSFKIQHAVNYF